MIQNIHNSGIISKFRAFWAVNALEIERIGRIRVARAGFEPGYPTQFISEEAERMDSFNKKGDKGTTSLMFGHRVPKNSPRPEAYGVIDEASSAMGLARGFISEPELKQIILSIQQDLILVGAELACLPDDVPKMKARITDDHARSLEHIIEKYETLTVMPREFVPPGGTPASGALDLARAIIRRGERRIAGLAAEGEVANQALQSYCNRLADLLFTLARYVDSNEK